MAANPYDLEQHVATQEEQVRNRSVNLGNELLNRAKAVSQRIEERVRAVCGEVQQEKGREEGQTGKEELS